MHDAAAAEFADKGWCVLKQFMPPQEVAALTVRLDDYLAALAQRRFKADGRHAKWAEDDDRSKPQLLVNMVETELLPPEEMRRWLQLASILLGGKEDCRLMENEFTGKRIQYFDKPPGVSAPTPPHQDNYCEYASARRRLPPPASAQSLCV